MYIVDIYLIRTGPENVIKILKSDGRETLLQFVELLMPYL